MLQQKKYRLRQIYQQQKNSNWREKIKGKKIYVKES